VNMGILRAAVLAAAALAIGCGESRAGWMVTLEGQATPQGEGYAYLYTLTNQSTEGEFAIGLSIEVSTAANVIGFGTPPGWEVLYPAGNPTVDWVVIPAGDGGLDNVLLPGESVQFSFFSLYKPGTTSFSVVGDAAGQFVTTDGATVGPVNEPNGDVPIPTPEPTGLALCAAAGLTLAGRYALTRLRAT
jgi:hypothetical protein